MAPISTRIALFLLIHITLAITEAFLIQNPLVKQIGIEYFHHLNIYRVDPTLQSFHRRYNKKDLISFPRKSNNYNLLSSLSEDNQAGDTSVEKNQNQRQASAKNATIFLSISILCFAIIIWKYEVLFGLMQTIKPALFGIKDKLIKSLDYLNDLGNVGLIAYSFLLLIWEATVGMTTPIETCAGMAFGVKRGIIANAIGKISGALVAFMMGRFLLYDWVKNKLDQKDSDGNSKNEIFNLIESSFESNPIGVALIWRFSPLPEFIKNFGLSAIPGLKLRHFFVAVLLHGFPFTCLWTVLGAETSMVLRGIVSEPSRNLKIITSLVPPFGFIVSPTLVGLWIKSLKKKQVQQHEKKIK